MQLYIVTMKTIMNSHIQQYPNRSDTKTLEGSRNY